MLDVARNAATVLLLVCMVPACSDTPKQAEFMKGQPMETECDQIARNSNLNVELDFSEQQGRAYVHFANNTPMPLWFPAEQEPAFRPDEHAKALTIWYGYFDEVYGEQVGRYMTPPMRLVLPVSDIKVEITSPSLVEKLLQRHLSPHLKVRLGTRELPESNTRGDQPLADYVQHSCVIDEPGTRKTDKK